MQSQNHERLVISSLNLLAARSVVGKTSSARCVSGRAKWLSENHSLSIKVEFDIDDAGVELLLDIVQSEGAILTVVSGSERRDEFTLPNRMSVADRGGKVFVDSKRSTVSYLLEGKAERMQK